MKGIVIFMKATKLTAVLLAAAIAPLSLNTSPLHSASTVFAEDSLDIIGQRQITSFGKSNGKRSFRQILIPLTESCAAKPIIGSGTFRILLKEIQSDTPDSGIAAHTLKTFC